MSGAPAGVNMPKKKDPRLRGVQAPPQKQFFDSADYEVRKQQQAQNSGGATGGHQVNRGGPGSAQQASRVSPQHQGSGAGQAPPAPPQRQPPQ